MSNIKVKNNAGIQVIYNDIDTVVLPTSDGGTAVFRKWNGITAVTSAVSVHTHHTAVKTAVVKTIQTTASAHL